MHDIGWMVLDHVASDILSMALKKAGMEGWSNQSLPQVREEQESQGGSDSERF